MEKIIYVDRLFLILSYVIRFLSQEIDLRKILLCATGLKRVTPNDWLHQTHCWEQWCKGLSQLDGAVDQYYSEKAENVKHTVHFWLYTQEFKSYLVNKIEQKIYIMWFRCALFYYYYLFYYALFKMLSKTKSPNLILYTKKA